MEAKPCGDVPAPSVAAARSTTLELEEVPLGADDGSDGETLEKTGPGSAW
jgi:hypothetical protein